MITDLPPARILAIETSCDETASAVIENGRSLLASVVASQMDIHSRYGGVFPEVASRQHVLSIVPVVEQTLAQAHLALTDVDAIAVTQGPGLAGSLVVGLNMAKGLALGSGLPLVGVNHLEGHIYSAWVHDSTEESPSAPKFPLLALLVSGGHTELNIMEDHLSYKRLGATLDDAAGEAFDKVARLLGLPYPGGPSIQKAAEEGNPKAFSFPRARTDSAWDFSFSGIKTSVMREVKRIEEKGNASLCLTWRLHFKQLWSIRCLPRPFWQPAISKWWKYLSLVVYPPIAPSGLPFLLRMSIRSTSRNSPFAPTMQP
jgi:N6-L-threonylcarbamoyladenine synthase